MDLLVECFDPSKKTLLIFGNEGCALNANIRVRTVDLVLEADQSPSAKSFSLLLS